MDRDDNVPCKLGNNIRETHHKSSQIPRRLTSIKLLRKPNTDGIINWLRRARQPLRDFLGCLRQPGQLRNKHPKSKRANSAHFIKFNIP